MYLVPERIAKRLVPVTEAIPLIESAFRAYDAGISRVFAVAVGHGYRNAGGFGVKLGLDGERQTPGLKMGSYWPENRDRGLPNHGSTTVLLDNDTGLPRAIIGAGHLTAIRTAAADAVAVKYLSRPEAGILAVIGSGHQAYYEVAAISAVRRLDEIRIGARTAAAGQALCARLGAAGLRAAVMTREKAVQAADIVVTITSARTPVVEDQWVRPGTHISAMGADAIGKHELPISLVQRSRCFADVIDQSCRIGEFQHACNAQLLAREDIVPLGGVITGRIPGRTGAEDITIFDSSGMALQDLAIGDLALQRAIADGVALEIDW